jgi:CHASE1-domain containing sensor protein
MQVELAVQSAPQESGSWNTFSQMSRWVSVVIIIFVVILTIFLVLFALSMFVHNHRFALKVMRRKKAIKRHAEKELKSSVV